MTPLLTWPVCHHAALDAISFTSVFVAVSVITDACIITIIIDSVIITSTMKSIILLVMLTITAI